MSEHDEVRELLSLAAAGALDSGEEERVTLHIRSCALCSSALDDWRLIAGGLRRLPTPQPSRGVVERARAMAEVRFGQESEHRWNRNVMIFLVAFAWVLTLLSWPLVRLMSEGLQGLLDPRFNQAWIAFAVLTSLGWLGGGVAAILLSVRQRRERRLA
jgi:Putative zinc-finger